jgi:rubredoxin
MLKIKEELISKVKSECPECGSQNEYFSNYPLYMQIITQKCEVCGHEYKIDVV